MAVSSQFHAAAALPPGMNSVPTEQAFGWVLQTQSGRFGEEKNLLSLPGFKPRIIDSSLATVLTTLFWLLRCKVKVKVTL
jgi:hypothetical protein